MVTKARQVYNWSFRNLPLTQHQKIWKKFVVWVMKLDNHWSALKVIPRYLKINPDFKENFVEYLLEKNLFDKAAEVLMAILDDDGYSGKAGKEKKDFYFDLIELLTEHPDKIKCVEGYKFIRQALKLYPEDSGKIWVKLGDYFIRLGQFDKAREVLEEAVEEIDNAKDFGVIFSAYVKFEQEMITALADDDIQSFFEVEEKDNVEHEIEVRTKRLKRLLDKHPYLLINISIKKSPNTIQNWLNLVGLY